MSLPVYASRAVSVAWGSVPLDGFTPDSFVTFSRSADVTDEEVGADGQVAISELPDKTGTCTLSFQQNSPANLILSGIIQAQDAGAPLSRYSLTINDPSGSVLAVLTNCHIKTLPEISLGSSATGQSRDWVFFCEGMKFISVPEGVAEGSDVAVRIAGAVTTILGNI